MNYWEENSLEGDSLPFGHEGAEFFYYIINLTVDEFCLNLSIMEKWIKSTKLGGSSYCNKKAHVDVVFSP